MIHAWAVFVFLGAIALVLICGARVAIRIYDKVNGDRK